VGLQELSGRPNCSRWWRWLFHGDEDREESERVCEMFVELSSRTACSCLTREERVESWGGGRQVD
jgi:hypothetical protein